MLRAAKSCRRPRRGLLSIHITAHRVSIRVLLMLWATHMPTWPFWDGIYTACESRSSLRSHRFGLTKDPTKSTGSIALRRTLWRTLVLGMLSLWRALSIVGRRCLALLTGISLL